jgi:hypothetical protein
MKTPNKPSAVNVLLTGIPWFLAIVLVVLSSCADEAVPDNRPKVYCDSHDMKYRGGLLKFWAEWPDTEVESSEQLRWKTGKGQIATRESERSRDLIVGDTVYIHWEELPTPTVELDTTLNDTGGVASVDSIKYYIDSIAIIVDDYEAKNVAVEILNILPAFDSLYVAGTVAPADSTILLAAHPGEKINFYYTYRDTFNQDYAPEVSWPSFGGDVRPLSGDSLPGWSVRFPNNVLDTNLPLVMRDRGGYGERNYMLHIVSYRESGSAWAFAGGDLVKFSTSGSEILRLKDRFQSVSDLIIDPNLHRMWILDRETNGVYTYNTFGEELGYDTAFTDPLSVAIDVESNLLWVSDLENPDSSVSRIRKFDISNPSEFVELSSFSVPGPVRGFAANQYERDFLWFVSPESDFVGYIITGADSAIIFDEGFDFNRPTMVSYAPESGMAWIADSSRVVVMDTSGTIHARITGFQYANALSAAGDACWISDIMRGEVVRFEQDITGSLTISDGLRVQSLVTPTSLATFGLDGSVWVSDRGLGQVLLFDSDGDLQSAATGLTLPSLVRVHQVVE